MRGQRQTKPPTASMPSNRHQGPPSGHPSIHPAIHPSARATLARCVLQHSTLRRGRTLAAQAAAPNPRTGMPCVQRAQLRALHEYCPYSVHAPTARFQATWRHGRQWMEGKARYPSPKVTLVLFSCRFSFSLGRSRPPIRPRPRPPSPPVNRPAARPNFPAALQPLPPPRLRWPEAAPPSPGRYPSAAPPLLELPAKRLGGSSPPPPSPPVCPVAPFSGRSRPEVFFCPYRPRVEVLGSRYPPHCPALVPTRPKPPF